MRPVTHLDIVQGLCGTPVSLAAGSATVRLKTTDEMSVDSRGLVHGGFVFGAADYAAMLAVNDPNVVLGACECRFLAPVSVGQTIDLVATRSAQKGRKHTIEVTATVRAKTVFTGTLTTFVLDTHVLDG
jgi:acyl-coenzyme A thioesterase PaaI-like protein